MPPRFSSPLPHPLLPPSLSPLHPFASSQPPCHDPSPTPCSVADSPYTSVYFASPFHLRLRTSPSLLGILLSLSPIWQHRFDRNRISLRCVCSASARISGVCYTCHVLYTNGRALASAPSHYIRHETTRMNAGNDEKSCDVCMRAKCQMQRDDVEKESIVRESRDPRGRRGGEGGMTIEST